MHTLHTVNRAFYSNVVNSLVSDASDKYQRICYISFNDPFNVVVNFLEKSRNADESKFIVVDASTQQNQNEAINEGTYTIPTQDIFRTYMLLRELIMDHGVDLLLMDSISALIKKFHNFPLQRMITDLYLEVGGYRCDTQSIIFDEHTDHDITHALRPFVSKNVTW